MSKFHLQYLFILSQHDRWIITSLLILKDPHIAAYITSLLIGSSHSDLHHIFAHRILTQRSTSHLCSQDPHIAAYITSLLIGSSHSDLHHIFAHRILTQRPTLYQRSAQIYYYNAFIQAINYSGKVIILSCEADNPMDEFTANSSRSMELFRHYAVQDYSA